MSVVNESMTKIRYYNTIRISAGEGSLDFEDDPFYENVSCSDEFLASIGIRSSHDAALLNVSGNSMSPLYEDGDRVVVDTRKNTVISGKVYVMILNGEFLVKRVNSKDGALCLLSENKSYEAKELSNSDTFRVIGEVAGIWDDTCVPS